MKLQQFVYIALLFLHAQVFWGANATEDIFETIEGKVNEAFEILFKDVPSSTGYNWYVVFVDSVKPDLPKLRAGISENKYLTKDKAFETVEADNLEITQVSRKDGLESDKLEITKLSPKHGLESEEAPFGRELNMYSIITAKKAGTYYVSYANLRIFHKVNDENLKFRNFEVIVR